MSQRMRKVERLLKVQSQLQQSAEWRLAALERRKHELDSTQVALIEALSEDTCLQGLFVDTTARRLQRLAGEASEVKAACAVQREIVIDRAMQARRTEKMAQKIKDENRREAEKEDLLSILDQVFGRQCKPPAS